MRVLLPLALLISFQAAVLGRTIRVPGEFAAIQPALDAAQPGDTVLVGAGEYEVKEPLTFRGKPLALRSESGAASTTIRTSATPADPARTSAVVFENGETREALLEGFKVSGGVSCGQGRPSISNCEVDALSAQCLDSAPRFDSCFIRNVELTGFAAADFIHSSVERLEADRGEAYFEDSVLDSANVYGGFRLLRCRVGSLKGNDLSDFDLESCILGRADMVECADIDLSNTTVLGGVSAQVLSHLSVFNSILWPDTGPSITLDGSSTADVTYSIVRGDSVWPGEGNSNADPLFVSSSDHHLRPGSPAIDAGSGRPAGTDLDKNPRLCGPRPDLGAYESCPPGARFLRGDVVADSRRDLSDAAAVLRFLFETGMGVACENAADVNDDGGIDVSDAIALLGYLFLGGHAPPPPFTDCGLDPSPGGLSCESSPSCG